MRQLQKTLHVATDGRSLVDLTDDVASIVLASGVQIGLCVVFCRHTSASLTIQENADPDVGRDLLGWLARMAPDGDPLHLHAAEGPDDMPAHLRTVLTSSNESIPVAGGRLALGTWQGLYLLEHRKRPHRREVVVHVLGE